MVWTSEPTLKFVYDDDTETGEYMPGPARPASLVSASNMSAGILLLMIASHRSHSALVLNDRSALVQTEEAHQWRTD